MEPSQFPSFLHELRESNPEKFAIISQLYEDCPKSFSRNEAPVVHSRTLANKDSLGVGPAGRFSIGRKVMYLRDPYFEWLAKTIRV